MLTPEPPEPPVDREVAPDGPLTAGDGRQRPDWLVGAEEGLTAGQRAEDGPKPAPLSRPPLNLVNSAPREAETASQGEPPKSWAKPGTSIPKLAVVPRRERPSGAPASPDDSIALSAPEEGLSSAEPSEAATPNRPVELPEEPLWLVWGEFLAGNRLLQVAILVSVLAVTAYAYWPRQGRGVPLREIRQHPERFEGKPVTVQGRVGEVFDVGSGYVFHLVQGRDTVVVFASDRRPEPRSNVRVAGSVSTGYLDGTPRVAIFSTPLASSR